MAIIRFYRKTHIRPIEATLLGLLVLFFVAEISASQAENPTAFTALTVKADALNNPHLHPSLRRYVALVNSGQDNPTWQHDKASLRNTMSADTIGVCRFQLKEADQIAMHPDFPHIPLLGGGLRAIRDRSARE